MSESIRIIVIGDPAPDQQVDSFVVFPRIVVRFDIRCLNGNLYAQICPALKKRLC